MVSTQNGGSALLRSTRDGAWALAGDCGRSGCRTVPSRATATTGATANDPGSRESLRGTTVLTRPRPETDPQGTRLGLFFLFPRAELDETYNDNIFATPTKSSDFITTLAPSFDLLSNWTQDALNLHAGGAFGTYASHSSENYQDAFASADGRLILMKADRPLAACRFETGPIALFAELAWCRG